MELALRTRVLAFAAGAALLVALVGAYSLFSSRDLARRSAELQQQRVRPLIALDQVARALERQRAAVLRTLAATDDLMQEALASQVEKDRATLVPAIDRLVDSEGDPGLRAQLGDLRAAMQSALGPSLQPVIEFLKKGQFAEADIASQTGYLPRMDVVSRALDASIALESTLAEREYEAAAAAVRRQALITSAVVGGALAGGILLALAIARSLRRVLGADERELARAVEAIAHGDLSRRVVVAAGDESSVAARLNHMAGAFGSLADEARGNAGYVYDTASRLTESGRDLSGRTASQAANLEETAASMQQIAATVRENSQRTDEARRRAADLALHAADGGKAMAEAEATMDGIAQSAARIGEIIASIDAIAFQTNILALNAAVEAARAGESGRGFAVVATEVRALSQRSAASAREIRTLVEDAVSRAHQGSARVLEAGSRIRDLVAATHDVTRRMEEIADATREQAVGIRQVNGALEQLDDATQRNAALAEETAADAAEMARRAEALVDSVARISGDAFSALDGTGSPTPSPTSPLRLSSVASAT